MTLTQITEKGIKDGEIVNADINANAGIAGSKISPVFGSQNISTSGILILSNSSTSPEISFTGSGPNFLRFNDSAETDVGLDFVWRDTPNTLAIEKKSDHTVLWSINHSGQATIANNLDVGAGLDVTGNITGTGDLTLSNGGTDRLKMTHAGGGQFVIKNPSAASLTFGTNNQNNELVIANGGKVGIGATSPLSDLQIKTTGTHNGTLRVGGSSADLGFLFEYDQASATTSKIYANPTYTNTGALLHIAVDGDANPNQLVLKGSGNVGIGTDNPIYPLSVVAASGKASIQIKSDGTGANDDAFLRMQTEGSAKDCWIDFGDAADQDIGHIRYNHGNDFMSFTTNTGERVRIDSTGKVGIGKTSPTFKLDVEDSTNNTLRLGNSSETGHGSHDVKIAAGRNNYHNFRFEGSNYYFYGFNGSNTAEHFRIRSTGGVTFNGDTAAANALDDYEEGTWTPTLNEGNNAVSLTYAQARYVKIGAMVYAFWRVDVATTSASGHLIMSGLPFNNSSTQPATGGTAKDYQNYDIENGPIYHLPNGQSNLQFYKNEGNNFAASNASGKSFRGCTIYSTV